MMTATRKSEGQMPKRPQQSISRFGELLTAASTFLAIAHNITERGNLMHDLEQIAPHLQPANIRDFADALKLVGKQEAARSPMVSLADLKRLPTPEWIAHENKQGKKSHWIAKWQGLTLKIERRKTDKVVFHGFINDQEVSQDKKMTFVQAEVAAEALRRVRLSAAGS